MKKSVVHDLEPLIDKTIQNLRVKKFKMDPIVDKEFSKIASLVGSSQKRHGKIIEQAIGAALRFYPRYEVWEEPQFKVSRRVNSVLTNVANVKKNPDWLEFMNNHFDYGDSERYQQVDLIAYDKTREKIIALEVKRGYGNHDAGKKKKILQEILATKMLISSYGKSQGLKIKDSDAFICSYYGAPEFDRKVSISKNDLDELFEVEILEMVEEVNHFYRKKIRELANEWISSIK